MMRIGMGYDAHRFEAGRPLVLGGVVIPNESGLAGHSDADVLVHAISDALLGACGQPDIGVLFPPGDPETAGISSMKILTEAVRRVNAAWLTIINIDAVVVAEAPKIAPHTAAMKKALDGVMRCGMDCIGIKATTTEGMGFTGRGEGIAAYAVALLQVSR
jgi:2-C-methyl-D-erythritol 2,4-cyclodiphosphate synthase